MNLIESLRVAQMTQIMAIPSFKSGWQSRKEFLLSKSGTKSRTDLIALGDYLSETFLLGKGAGRSQSGVSTAGVAWESLITWYINLCLAGTEAVCLRGNAFIPEAVKQAMEVSFSNKVLRSESDVLILGLPQASNIIPDKPNAKGIREALDSFCSHNFDKLGVINIQCKTNWNDNAQIPMLWNMLYTQSRKGAMISNGFCIGGSAYSLRGLGYFAYAFATVPTNNWTEYKASDLCVLRAQTMSGGNYWGRATKNGIARSISTVFSEFSKSPHVFPQTSEIGKHSAKQLASGVLDCFY
jgi:hypothetical protein